MMDMPGLVSVTIAALDDIAATGRRLAIMGPNGVGKSHLLRQIHHALQQEHKTAVLIQSQRQITIGDLDNNRPPLNGELDTAVMDMLSQLGSAEQGRSAGASAREQLTVGRAFSWLLAMIQRADQTADNRFAHAAAAWLDQGKSGPEPRRDTSKKLQVEQLLATILNGEVSIRLGPNLNFTFSLARPNGRKSGLNALSDGEKQLVLLGLWLLGSDTGRFVLLVDEPELYLNEARAISLWESLERRFPKAVFIYATHSLVFATRPSIDATYLLTPEGNLEDVDRELPLDPNLVREFMGARIQLLRSAASPVFCEDQLAKLVVGDILEGSDAEIVGLNGWRSVITAVTADDSAWKKLRTPATAFCGVIDRDVLSAEQITAYEKKGVFCLPFYDPEGVLLAPELARWWLGRSAGTQIDELEYETLLRGCAQHALGGTLALVAEDFASRARPKLSVTVGTGPDYKANVEVKALQVDVEGLTKRADLLIAIMTTGTPLQIIEAFKGKFLYKGIQMLAPQKWKGLKVPDANQKYNEIRDHPEFKKLLLQQPPLAELKGKIVSYLSAASGGPTAQL